MGNGRPMAGNNKLKAAEIFMMWLTPLTYLPSCYVQSLLTPPVNQPQALSPAGTVRLFTALPLHLHHRGSLPPLLLRNSAPVLDRPFTHICKLISNLKPHPRPHPTILPPWLPGPLPPPSFYPPPLHSPSVLLASVSWRGGAWLGAKRMHTQTSVQPGTTRKRCSAAFLFLSPQFCITKTLIAHVEDVDMRTCFCVGWHSLM